MPGPKERELKPSSNDDPLIKYYVNIPTSAMQIFREESEIQQRNITWLLRSYLVAYAKQLEFQHEKAGV